MMVRALWIVSVTGHDYCVVPTLLASDMLDRTHVAEMRVDHDHGEGPLRHVGDVGLRDAAMHAAPLVGSGRYLGDVLKVELWLIWTEEHCHFDGGLCYAH